MVGAAPPCPHHDETHQERPRRRIGSSRRTARDVRGPCWVQARGQASTSSCPWLLLPLPLPTPSGTYFCCEDVLSRRGLRLPPECACRGAVVGGRTQFSGGKDVPDPTSQARVRARRPRNREGPGGAVRRSQAPAASDAQPRLGGQEHQGAQHQQQPDGVGRRLLEDLGVRAGGVHRG